MNDRSTAEVTVEVADALERNLKPVGDFFGKGVQQKVQNDVVGPVLNVPRKIASYGPALVDRTGLSPNGELQDRMREFTQALDTDLLETLPGAHQLGFKGVEEQSVTDQAPDRPAGDTANTGVIDP